MYAKVVHTVQSKSMLKMLICSFFFIKEICSFHLGIARKTRGGLYCKRTECNEVKKIADECGRTECLCCACLTVLGNQALCPRVKAVHEPVSSGHNVL